MNEQQHVEIGRCDRCGAYGPVIVTRHVAEGGKVTENRGCTNHAACDQRQAVASSLP